MTAYLFVDERRKTVKKFLAIFLSTILVLTLVACSNESIEKLGAEIKDELGITNGTNSEFVPTGVTPAIGPSDTQSSDDGSATSTDSTVANLITRDRAIELALNHAGLTKAEVRDLEAELDYEPYGVFWEVDFEANRLDYSYDVNAETEAVARVEKERD